MPVDSEEEALLADAGIEVQGEIGRGASGVVYRGRHLLLDRPLALKRVVCDELEDTLALRRLEVEISVLVGLRHPGIVRLMDVKCIGRAMWLVMEYVDGPTLRDVLTRRAGHLATADSLAILEQLCAALDHVAKQDVVHRDIKPANVFLSRRGRCKVGDFGIALSACAARSETTEDESGGDTRATRPGTVLGTPSYLSPEQAAGREATPASDVYSLGVLAYELLVGRVPFPFTGNLLGMLAAQVRDMPPSPRSLRPEIDTEVEAVLLWPLEKEPLRRPESADAFWERMETVARSACPRWREEADLEALVATLLAGSTSSGAGAARGDATVEEVDTLAVSAAVPEQATRPPDESVGKNPVPMPPSATPRARPGRKRRDHRRSSLSLSIAAVVFGAAACGSFLAVRAIEGPTVAKGSELLVRSISLYSRRSPRPSSCSRVEVVARIAVRSAPGDLGYKWSTPTDSPAGTVRVGTGTRSVILILHFAVRPPGRETVALRVSTRLSRRVRTLPVSARC